MSRGFIYFHVTRLSNGVCLRSYSYNVQRYFYPIIEKLYTHANVHVIQQIFNQSCFYSKTKYKVTNDILNQSTKIQVLKIRLQRLRIIHRKLNGQCFVTLRVLHTEYW